MKPYIVKNLDTEEQKEVKPFKEKFMTKTE